MRANTIVGHINGDALDTRGRFDTLGRTVYFSDSPEAAFAEVFSPFRRERGALAADAAASGMGLDEYIDAVTEDAEARGMDTPWGIGGDWQMARSLYRVRMPLQGWWVDIEHRDTLAAITKNMTATLGGTRRRTALRTDLRRGGRGRAYPRAEYAGYPTVRRRMPADDRPRPGDLRPLEIRPLRLVAAPAPPRVARDTTIERPVRPVVRRDGTGNARRTGLEASMHGRHHHPAVLA
ncbi:hypothetical protein ACPPVS_12610 [Cellulomonas sp. McL0617]|uniref:hypothetical protein n=1 Tax=Cellulomonas sp. McL0617 TaxID=3415675 RepID=UPI003CEB003D